MKVYFDTESNGLLGEMTHFWCMVLINEAGKSWRFIKDGHEKDGSYPISTFPDKLREIIEESTDETPATFICHNLFDFDLPAIREHLGVQFGYDWWGSPDNRCKFIDSLEFSRTLFPDRSLPKGCPTSIPNPVTGKAKRIGAHGLEAWGWRTGDKKPQVHDWINGDPMVYLNRCKKDVSNNRLAYSMMLQEFKENRL